MIVPKPYYGEPYDDYLNRCLEIIENYIKRRLNMFANNKLTIDRPDQLKTDDLEQGMLIQDNEGDTYIYTDEGCIVDLQNGDQYGDPQNFEPFTLVKKITIETVEQS